MCLIGIKLRYNNHGEARLVVAANRDEFHQRPAATAHWWNSQRDLFAGRDLSAGGTWLGVSRSGRFAALTNVRSLNTIAAGPAALSRGDLPVQFLASARSSAEFCQQLIATEADYGGFNLLTFDGRQLWWCSNQGQPARQVAPGIHSLSNASLDTPWPKAEAIALVLAQTEDPQRLLAALRVRDIPPGELPNTGIAADLERRLAPAFISGQDYGTRCSSVVTLDSNGGQMLEVSYNRIGEPENKVVQEFSVREF